MLDDTPLNLGASTDELIRDKTRVTLLHSGMPMMTRREHIDTFNALDSPLMILIGNVNLFAEGVSLIGANNVVVESPIGIPSKYNQFIRRPIRHGQLEKKIVVRLLHNKSSASERKAVEAMDIKEKATQAVDESTVDDVAKHRKVIDLTDSPEYV
ncbi:hypothetical protein J1614_012200 [Plenodomus biglobosus]|nr:hypothetical protein J1614_012200 [Plenodomus biglobosus]